jgi:2-isopropylmalate synthase
MKPQVEIYDTTLRDGSQGEGINFSVADKLRIAEKLDQFGVHYIEGGPAPIPTSNLLEQSGGVQERETGRLGSTRKKGDSGTRRSVRLLIEAETLWSIFGRPPCT